MHKKYKRDFDQIQAIVADTERFFSDQDIDPEGYVGAWLLPQ